MGLPDDVAFASAYLRAAQAYMLISMPTGTSTIFGAFQDIRFPLGLRHYCRLGKLTAEFAQSFYRLGQGNPAPERRA
jgi:hypothetical protein